MPFGVQVQVLSRAPFPDFFLRSLCFDLLNIQFRRHLRNYALTYPDAKPKSHLDFANNSVTTKLNQDGFLGLNRIIVTYKLFAL